MASIMELKDETFIISIENYASSGRSSQNMHLSKESLIGVLSTSILFLSKKGFDLQAELEKSVGDKKEVAYMCSESLCIDEKGTSHV